ncbi:hypothetical protein [Rhizorhabdus argentea]|uniref:hypothetical protein n=1 Tax=Rhizorhabdus argentea TaxID=1387174 RepID=UPI0030EE0015
MIIIYAFGAVTLAMLAIVCVAIIAEVKRGNYTKGLIGSEKLEARHPAAAVCSVLAPFAVIFITATSNGDLSFWGSVAFASLAALLGWLIWRTAEKLWRKVHP